MTTAAKTNYGAILGKQDTTMAYATIGEVVSVDPPDYMEPAVEATNHGSGGVREFIASGLSEMSEFKVTVNYIKANIATLKTDMLAGTKGRYQLALDSADLWQFGALVTSIKPTTADAQNPGVLQAEITFRPSDSMSVSS